MYRPAARTGPKEKRSPYSLAGSGQPSLRLEMSRAPTASALISTFVRDIPHRLLILLHDVVGQRWPSSVIADCRTALGRPRPHRAHLSDLSAAGPMSPCDMMTGYP